MGELQPGMDFAQEVSKQPPKSVVMEKLTEIDIADRLIDLEKFRQYRGLLCGVNGVVNAGYLKYEISEAMVQLGQDDKPNIAAKVNAIFNLIDIRAYASPLTIQKNTIHCKNGTITVDLSTGEYEFRPELETCLYRINCAYDPTAPPPTHFLRWLKEVFASGEDRETLIEYLGYALLPITTAHKALSVVGNGGTGKSIIGKHLYKIWGDARLDGDLSDLGKTFEISRFEAAPIFYCDDASDTELNPQTEAMVKKLITADTPVRAEQKYKDVSSILPTTKFIVCGEAPLRNLMTGSDGFGRRWLILHTSEIPKDRVVDPNLADKFDTELDGIFMLMLTGLSNLIKRGFQFKVSEYAKEYLSTVKTDGGSPEAFISEMLIFGEEYGVTAKELGDAYRAWCYSNEVDMSKGGRTAVSKYLSAHPEKYGIKAVNNIGSIHSRGYYGVTLKNAQTKVNTRIALDTILRKAGDKK